MDAWITHNEPWVVAFLGHAEGVKAPGIRDWPTALRASHHLLLSHGLGGRRRCAPTRRRAGRASRSNLAPARAATPSDEDRAAAARMDGYLNRWFLDPVLRGRYPEDMVEHYERRYGPFDVVRDGDLRDDRARRSTSSASTTTSRSACGRTRRASRSSSRA